MSATMGSYRITDRDLADITREAMTSSFVAIAETLVAAPEDALARDVGARLLARKHEVIGRLVEAFDEKLREGDLDA